VRRRGRNGLTLFLRSNVAQSPEMETLAQLLGGEMRLSIIRGFYDSAEHFARGTMGLLQDGDVRLFDQSHTEVPRWRWRPLFEEGEVLSALESFTLDVTDAGAAKVS
jgi:hypothetical protein